MPVGVPPRVPVLPVGAGLLPPPLLGLGLLGLGLLTDLAIYFLRIYCSNVTGQGTRHFVAGTLDPIVQNLHYVARSLRERAGGRRRR